MSCAGVFSNGNMLSVCEEQPVVSATFWVVWGSYGTPFANNSSRCSSILLLEAAFWWQEMAVGTLSFHLDFKYIYMYIYIHIYICIHIYIPKYISKYLFSLYVTHTHYIYIICIFLKLSPSFYIWNSLGSGTQVEAEWEIFLHMCSATCMHSYTYIIYMGK